MKKTVLLLTLLSTFAFCNELKTIYSYKKALEVAKAENKLVLFMTSIKSCPTCGYMKDIVFKREHVLNYLNENYVVVIKDIERQDYPKRFWTRDAPTFYFINALDEKEVREPKIGGANPEKFLKILQDAREGKHADANLPKEVINKKSSCSKNNEQNGTKELVPCSNKKVI